jgi:CubicO group peptidase (beta-lactamase class C family)
MNNLVATYGAHQYSNLGYQILGDAIEIAVNKSTPMEAPLRTYKDEIRDRMLRPLRLASTKFPEKIKDSDNLARSTYSDASGRVVDSKDFQGAGSAGGIFASAADI